MRPRLVFLIAFAFLVACGDDGDGQGAAAQAPPLEGTPWIVASGLDAPGWEQFAPSARFERGQVSGDSGCNRYSGSYELDGDRLTVGKTTGTLMACEAGADAVEREFLGALGDVAGWRMEEAELVLLDGDGKELLRLREASPVGSWTVSGIRYPDSVSSVVEGTEVTAVFGEDGTLSGSGGCNPYNTTYTSSNGSLKIAEPAGGRKACPEPEGVMEQEHAYLTALPRTASYEITGSQMTLLAADGTIIATLVRAS